MARQVFTNEEQKLWAEQVVWQWRTRYAWSQSRIVAELQTKYNLTVTQSTVSRILKRVRKREAAALSDQVEQLLAEQSETLQYIVAEALSGWERSKEPQKALTRRTTEAVPARLNGHKRPPGEAEDEEEAQAALLKEILTTNQIKELFGDVRFLHQAREAMKDIREIWAVQGSGGAEEVVITVKREPGGLARPHVKAYVEADDGGE